MPDEVLHWIGEISPRVIVDGTYGGGGHSRLFLQQLPAEGRVIGLDRDPAVSRRSEAQPTDPRLTVFLGSYEQTPKALAVAEIEQADAMLLDLGLSSDQLADRDRGFSFTADGPLDLRFDPENNTPASTWLARHSETEIADAIYQYGEERYSRRIAKVIVEKGETEGTRENGGRLGADLSALCPAQQESRHSSGNAYLSSLADCRQ